MKPLNIPKIQLEKLYLIDGLSQRQIGELYNTNQSVIGKYLRKYNIASRRDGAVCKYTKNEEYFRIPSIWNSYWAGFIAADGCISNNTVSIKINSKDKLILENFSRDCEYTGPIKDNISRQKHLGCDLTICSAKNWINDLASNWNILPRKSLTLQPPNIGISNTQISYIIGLIDGDGCILIDKFNKLKLNIIGTKEILEWVNLVTGNFGAIYKKDKSSNKNTYSLQAYNIKAKKILEPMLDIIKNHNLSVLDRKWSRCRNA